MTRMLKLNGEPRFLATRGEDKAHPGGCAGSDRPWAVARPQSTKLSSAGVRK